MEDIKKGYETISAKLKLPRFEDLDKDFEISTIDNETRLLTNIRRKIAEKMEHQARLLEGLLNPETTPASLHESNAFSESGKDKIFKLYKKVMYILRRSEELEIAGQEEEEASYIKDVCSEWKSMKEELLDIMIKLKESWREEPDRSERMEYFG